MLPVVMFFDDYKLEISDYDSEIHHRDPLGIFWGIPVHVEISVYSRGGPVGFRG